MTTYFLYSFDPATRVWTYQGCMKHRSYMQLRAVVREEIEIRLDKRWSHRNDEIGATL